MAAKKKATAKAAAPRKAAKPEAPVVQQVSKTVDGLLRKDAGSKAEFDFQKFLNQDSAA